ncbi:MAG: hypothetical protein JZD40_04340 [Sulfolobus sp.]|nr:hypothetical protein [Sulfolobus sp.]
MASQGATNPNVAETAKGVGTAIGRVILYIIVYVVVSAVVKYIFETFLPTEFKIDIVSYEPYVQILLTLAFGYLIVSGIAQVFYVSLVAKYGHPTAAAVRNIIRIIGIGALAAAIAGGVAGVDDNGEIDITGFEAVRGDWCDYAKNVQRGVIEVILKTGDVNAAVRYVKDSVLKLRKRQFRIEDLVIWKSIDKDINEYDRSDPHIVAALKAIKAGYAFFKGSKIGYVIVKGSGKISERAEPYFMIKDYSVIDVEYYIDRQIVPAAMRIRSVIFIDIFVY